MSEVQANSQPYRPVQEKAPLPERVAEQIRSMIIDGTLAPGQRLSTEPQLAIALGVSRSTLRAALDRLVHDGHIVRKRGVGTFVSARPAVPTDLNLNRGATELIRATGAVPGTADLRLFVDQQPDGRVMQKLELECPCSVVVVDRVRTMSGRRVISALECLPGPLFAGDAKHELVHKLEDTLQREHSIHAFLEQVLHLEIQQGVASLKPAFADAATARRLHVSPGSLLMRLEQVDYASDGLPLLLSEEYWVSDAFTFTVRRHR
jgi:GntR family transcriptional regulator